MAVAGYARQAPMFPRLWYGSPMSARIARIPGVLALIALGCAPANNGVKPDTSSANADEGAADDAPDDDDGPAETTGQTCKKTIVLMGYWPPTNEMLRPWSTNPAQNPGGWQGENWRGHGFDVYAFFPEFPPDGDPSNDEIGDPGSVGSPDFDLQVDYQATSADFWRIVDTHAPRLLITTSRGGQIGWEIEALEGGHGDDNPDGPAADWIAESALMGLQIRRLFRAGGGEHRNVYDSIDRAEVFIRSHLSAAELTAFRRFIADYVPTA